MPVSPAQYEAFAEEMYRVYAEAENDLLRRIAQRLSTGGEEPRWMQRKLSEIEILRADAERILGQVRKKNKQITKVIEANYRKGASIADDDLESMGIEIQFGLTNVNAVQVLAKKAVSALDNSHMIIMRSTLDSYRESVIYGAQQVTLGTMTRQQATQDMLNRLADSGISGFVDKAGRNWNMASYAEMATRSTTGQAAVQGHLDRLTEHGYELVYVSDSPEECEVCRPWEGKVLSVSGNQTMEQEVEVFNATGRLIDGSVSQAMATGLLHPNCTHTLSAFIPGLTEIITPNEGLTNAESNELYAEKQKQRAMERNIRKWKNREAVATTPEAKKLAQGKVKEHQAKMREYIKATNERREQAGIKTELARASHREQLRSGRTGEAPGRVDPPKPPPPKTTPPKKAAPGPKKAKADDDWETKARDLMNRGITSEADVSALGKVIREGIMPEVKDGMDQMATVTAARDKALKAALSGYKQYEARKLSGSDYNLLHDEYTRATDEFKKVRVQQGDIVREKWLGALSKLREFGHDQTHDWTDRSDDKVVEMVKDIRRLFPKDWLDDSYKAGKMDAAIIDRGYYAWNSIVPEFRVSEDPWDPRFVRKVAIHEMGHRFEHTVGQIRQFEREFYQRRTKGESLKWMGSGYGKNEVTRKDKFLNPYMGKEYSGSYKDYYELLSMGLEGLLDNTFPIHKDTDYMDFILGILAGV